MKSVFRLSIFLFVLSMVLPVAKPAQAAWWEFFFPSLRAVEEDPAKSMKAPFALDDEEKKIEVPTDEQDDTPLEEPHRLAADLSKWLETITSEAMSFESENYQDDLGRTKDYFSQEARAAYLKFLKDNKITTILESKRFYVRTIVQDDPIVLVEKPLDGRYRWLFEVPVLVTYLPINLTNYAKGDATTQEVMLNIQLGRVPEAPEHGVLIEQWDGKVTKTNSAKAP